MPEQTRTKLRARRPAHAVVASSRLAPTADAGGILLRVTLESPMSWLQALEALNYLVTIIGLPFAIVVFMLEQRRDRLNDEEEIHQKLSDEYAEFLKLVLDNSDLQLRSRQAVPNLTADQQERRMILFDLLVSLFERAYVLVYEEHMSRQQRRLWQSWEDYMREWCRREEFRSVLPELLRGEDEDFRRYLLKLTQDRE